MRLDDASENMNLFNWIRMKELLDRYGIRPIYGIIPYNQDPDLLKYEKVSGFWQLMRDWEQNGWIPALHGCSHVFETNEGGINPVNDRSEFAGLSLNIQKQKIRRGYEKLFEERIKPSIFFAPAHTFDENTLTALCDETDIRVISDTIAYDVYYRAPFYYIPQQSGKVRDIPFRTVTFCYHPNTMTDAEFETLEVFLSRNSRRFGSVPDLLCKRERNVIDKLLKTLYFVKRAIR